MVSIGWGHVLPMGDMLNSVNGRVGVDSFSFYEPNLKKHTLYKPEFKPENPSVKNKGFDIFNADQAVQKIALKKEATKGVYQIELKTEPTYYTIYLDSKDRQRLKLKPMDELKDAKKVIASFKYQGFAKSYLTIDEWKKPKPLGHDLEITPLSDLSNVKVGDEVKFKVTLKGKPLSNSPQGEKYATFLSNNFNQGEGVRLFAYIKNGITGFKVPTSGQWVINVYNTQNITKDNEVKDLYGKAKILMNAATVAFHVK